MSLVSTTHSRLFITAQTEIPKTIMTEVLRYTTTSNKTGRNSTHVRGIISTLS